MQDRFVGDIGDFGKYGLLRVLCAPRPLDGGGQLSLGVVWYRTPDGTDPAGEQRAYLNRTPENLARYRACDPELYDSLERTKDPSKRSVVLVRQWDILPQGTRFHEDILSFEGVSRRAARLAYRERYLERSRALTATCDIVFVDPDNGIEVKSTERHHKGGPQYCYLDELVPCVQGHKSLVVYQHFSRTDRATQMGHRTQAETASRFGKRSAAVCAEIHRQSLSGAPCF